MLCLTIDMLLPKKPATKGGQRRGGLLYNRPDLPFVPTLYCSGNLSKFLVVSGNSQSIFLMSSFLTLILWSSPLVCARKLHHYQIFISNNIVWMLIVYSICELALIGDYWRHSCISDKSTNKSNFYETQLVIVRVSLLYITLWSDHTSIGVGYVHLV